MPVLNKVYLGSTAIARIALGSAVRDLVAAPPPLATFAALPAVANMIEGPVASGDADPSEALNGWLYEGTTNITRVDGAYRFDMTGVTKNAMRATMDVAGSAGGLQSGKTYTAAADVTARVASSNAAIEFSAPLTRPDELGYPAGARHRRVRGVNSAMVTLPAGVNLNYVRFADRTSATYDNFRVFDMTPVLARPRDAILIIGQSVGVGNANFAQDVNGLDPADCYFDPRVLYMPCVDETGGSNGTRLAARHRLDVMCEPLQHQQSNSGVGIGGPMAAVLAESWFEGSTPVIIAAGWPGEGMVVDGGRWNPTGTGEFAGEAWAGMNAAIDAFFAQCAADGVAGTLRGVVLVHGEADSGAASAGQYQAKFETHFRDHIRAKVGDPALPFVIASPIPEFGGVANIAPAFDAIAAADARIVHVPAPSGYTFPEDPVFPTHLSRAGSGVHGTNIGNAMAALLAA